MADFSLRPKAISDLEGIWRYTVETWDEEQAEHYLRQINVGFVNLTTSPTMGQSFYRVLESGIDVVRVLHQQMDFQRHL